MWWQILQEISQPLCEYFVLWCLFASLNNYVIVGWGIMHVQIRTPRAQRVAEWNGNDLAWICSQSINVADVRSICRLGLHIDELKLSSSHFGVHENSWKHSRTAGMLNLKSKYVLKSHNYVYCDDFQQIWEVYSFNLRWAKGVAKLSKT